MQFSLQGISTVQYIENVRHILLALVMAIALAPVAFGAEPDPGGGAGMLISQGYDFLNDGKHVEAVDQFTEALSIDPRSLPAHEGLMWAYHNAGDTAKALKHADVMRQLAPADMEVLKKWMVVSVPVRDRETEVFAAARRLEKEHPDRINTLAFLGKTLSFSENHLPQAMQIYKQLLEEDPDNPDALRGLARRAKFDGDLVAALELLERAEQVHPLDNGVRSDLAEIRNDAERLRSARIGPTLPIIIAVAVLPLLFGSLILTINIRTYIILAVYTTTVSLTSLCWLYLMPLD